MKEFFRVLTVGLLLLIGILCCVSAFYWVKELESLPYPQSRGTILAHCFAFGVHMGAGYLFFRIVGKMWNQKNT